MPTYTPEQLREGVDITSFDGGTTFTFTNPGNSSYFFIEQNTNKNSNGSYNIDITSYTAGTFSSLSGISNRGIVENNFKFGIVIPPGVSSLTFTPTDTSGGGSIKLRGTGTLTLVTGDLLLLDQYGANVKIAYSVRKLSSTYSGNCIRVRNGSNVDADIGFDSDGNLDEAVLLDHCGSGDGFIAKWYDQSGNGGDLEQTTDAQQPQIVSSGAVLKENGKPIITGLAASNGSHLDLSGTKTTYLPSTGQHYFFSVSKVSTDRAILYREDARFQLIAQNGNSSTNTRNDPNYLSNTYRKNGAAITFATRARVRSNLNTQHLLTIDGSLDNGVSSFILGYGTANFANYSMQEFIVYEGDKASDQSNIETAINGHYSIF